MKKQPVQSSIVIEFVPKEIVWTKVKQYPWWPAQISKVPNQQNQFYKVLFFGQQTSAFLVPSAVKNYLDNYAQFSIKKSKKLQKAIALADQAVKQRVQLIARQRQKLLKKINNNNYIVAQSKIPTKPQKIQQPKPIKKQSKLIQKRRKKQQKAKQMAKRIRNANSIEKQNGRKDEQHSQEESKSFHLTPELMQQQLLQTEKEQIYQVDKAKIQRVQNDLLEIIQSIQQGKSQKNQKQRQTFCILEQNEDYYKRIKQFNINQLNEQQYCQSKVTKMLSYISKNTPNQPYKSCVTQIFQKIKKLIKQYLMNTDYYQNCIKQINKSKNHRQEFGRRVGRILHKEYQVRNQLGMMFGCKISEKMKNGDQVQFYKSLKDKRLDINFKGMNSKGNVDKIIEQVLSLYE